MTKFIRIAACLMTAIFSCSGSFAQTDQDKLRAPVSPGSITISPGAGPGISFESHSTDFIVGVKTAVEFGIWQAGPGVVTLGGELGLSTGDLSHNLFVAARSVWHYGWHVPGLDTYTGLSAGGRLRFNDNKAYHTEGFNDGTTLHPAVGVFVGGSYFLSRHFGVNIEAGYDITIIQVGLIFKLR
jgi:hypothetical protein